MTPVLLALAGCASNDDSHGEPVDSSGTDDTGDSGAGRSCTLLGGLTVSTSSVVLPADPVIATIADAGSGRDYAVTWSVSGGEIVSEVDGEVTWNLGEVIALRGPELMTISALAVADGCDPQTLEISITADWPDSERTVVVYNPSVDGSEEVAHYYAAFRDIPADALCAIASDEPSRLDAADLPAWIHAEQACIDSLGARARYVVPVYGVPFEVAGAVKDIAYDTYVTTSLDAQMVFANAALDLLEAYDDSAIYNPAYLAGRSEDEAYTPYAPYPELWDIVSKDAAFADAGTTPQLYLVARIDGSSPKAAMDLVDRTALAETLAAQGALDGIVYVDGRYGDEPPSSDAAGSYEAGEWNMWGTRYLFENLGWYDVVWDGDDAEFGTAPAPTECPDALYFAGWYSFDHYNGCFVWAPGAIGGHLDSASAGDVRGGNNWTHQALEAGITATFGAVEEPYVVGMPEYDQFFLYLTSGATFGEAAYESTMVAQWMMVWVGDPLYRPYPQ